MASRFLGLLLGCMFFQWGFAQIPEVYAGKLIRFPAFKSAHIQARNIDVWVSPGFSSENIVDVLYMHDGQMLFDSSTTWNKQEWGVDETLSKLIKENKMNSCVVVGIWNTPNRRQEYFPQDVFEQIPMPLKDSIVKDIGGIPYADLYVKFIVEELKPFIDSAFHLNSTPSHTFIGGASMGGLISFYTLCKHPEVFGGAFCLSTHWPGSVKRNETAVPMAFARFAKQQLPKLTSHKIYFDYGTETLDSWYEYGQQLIDEEMRKAGFTSANWKTQKFEGENHSENAWKKRLHIPLEFLLKK